MRPLRLLLDGFGSYRQPAEADFSDVDFFALVGPTGSGKSTLIDGLCFALYGTVPRWGKENAIAGALAPAANACRVCLVFEVAGRRYAAVRALSRDRKGQVHTKEARLELLDPAISPGAPIAELLEASIEQIAEGPDVVTAWVEDLLGLSYRHFTQSVLLPQGRFAEFLQAKGSARQDLLVELLAFGVYDKVGQRARERARLAAEITGNAERELKDIGDTTEAAETLAAARLQALASLAGTVDGKLAALAQLREQAGQAALQARTAREETALLAALQTPATVQGLATRIAQADKLVIEGKKRREDAEKLEAETERVRDALPDKTRTQTFRNVYGEQRELKAQLERQEQELAAQQDAEDAEAEKLHEAERKLEQGQAALAHAERAHAAIALAADLNVGDDCPVCLRPVASLPHHPAAANLSKAKALAEAAAKVYKRAQDAHSKAAQARAAAHGTRDSTQQQLSKSAAALAGAPSEANVTQSLEAIATADDSLRQARTEAAARRADVATAEKGRTALAGDEQRAWTQLRESRDSVVSLGAPAVEDTGLAAAWATLTTWAVARNADRTQHQPELDENASALQRRVVDDTAELTMLLAAHGVTDITDPARAPAAVAAYTIRAENELETVREHRKKAAKLEEQIRARREEEQVATELGRLLRASSFERWLCSEALDSLVAEASVTLMELSGGQYQLDRDDRNELVVIDYEDAGARRPVNTLSGGETFQASLALALALSRQVVGLSAGMRDLNSMFLDEGFGTLDEDTLETVGTTLERLSADSDRMIGIITHVAALAERAPVRFVVSHTGATSALRKERV
ncbi:MAG: AAA family ATPase [Streptosporangiaceae bacterium]|jgi:exonuclease SbcC